MNNVFKFLKLRSIEKTTKPIEKNYLFHLLENFNIKTEGLSIEKTLYYLIKNMKVANNDPLSTALTICSTAAQNYSYGNLYKTAYTINLDKVLLYFRANRNKEIFEATSYINENYLYRITVDEKKKEIKTYYTLTELRNIIVQLWDRLIFEVLLDKDQNHRDEVMALIRALSILEYCNLNKIDKAKKLSIKDFFNYEILIPELINSLYNVPEVTEVQKRPYEEQINVSSQSDRKEVTCIQPPVGNCNEYITQPLPTKQGMVKCLGFGDLLVVKKELIGFELGDIAAIRNVMKGETYETINRYLTREEITTFSSTETEKEESKELEINNRFELEKESEKTISEDSSLEAGITATAKYGTVATGGEYSISANAGYTNNNSKEESNREAQNIAQDITSRAVSKLILKTKEERTKTIFNEREDTTTHKLQGATNDNNVGVYYFLDKIYRSRVFNYGQRLMIELTVPEPASFYIHSKLGENANKLKGLNKPIEPSLYEVTYKDKKNNLSNYDVLNEGNYIYWANYYGAQVSPFPSKKVRKSISKEVNLKESILNSDSLEILIDKNYVGKKITKRFAALNDGASNVVRIWNFYVGGFDLSSVDEKTLSVSEELIDEVQINTSVICLNNFYRPNGDGGYEQASGPFVSYSLSVHIDCEITPDGIKEWQIDTYTKILEAYNNKLNEYNKQKEQKNFGKIEFGNNPNINRIIENEELKKSCISLITNQKFESFDAMQDKKGPNGYPEFNHTEARIEGKYIQFFEQMFEWTQMTFWCYDYFWGRKRNWIERKELQDNDPLFTKFLQAGAARVLLPVRPGYEKALLIYLKSGKTWGGNDTPVFNDPLFVSIVDQIKEAEGQTEAKPIGTPWEVRVPTNLVILPRQLNPDATCVTVDKHPDLPCFRVSKEFVIDPNGEYTMPNGEVSVNPLNNVIGKTDVRDSIIIK